MARAHVEILYKIESNNTWQSLIDNNIKILNIEENEILKFPIITIWEKLFTSAT